VALVGKVRQGYQVNIDDIVKWWRGKVDRPPLPGRITDYAATVGRYNRALSVNSTVLSVNQTFPANTNRVALFCGCFPNPIPTGAANLAVSLLDAGGANLLFVPLFVKEADVAAVTPSPFYLGSVYLDATMIGPLIQRAVFVTALGGIFVTFTELLVNPEMDMPGV